MINIPRYILEIHVYLKFYVAFFGVCMRMYILYSVHTYIYIYIYTMYVRM